MVGSLEGKLDTVIYCSFFSPGSGTVSLLAALRSRDAAIALQLCIDISDCVIALQPN